MPGADGVPLITGCGCVIAPVSACRLLTEVDRHYWPGASDPHRVSCRQGQSRLPAITVAGDPISAASRSSRDSVPILGSARDSRATSGV